MKHSLVFNWLVIVISIIAILSAAAEIRAEEQVPSGKADGYTWEDMEGFKVGRMEIGKMVRESMVRGFLEGFEDGYISACAKATLSVEPVMHGFPKKTNPEYYVREIDSFLKTYPLCRRENIWTLFLQLSQVWFYHDLSYEDIGKKCLQPDK